MQRFGYFICFYTLFCQLSSCTIVRRSTVHLSNLGLEFIPTDEQAVLLSDANANTRIFCAQMCSSQTLCRTFNYDTQSKRCRLYESEIDGSGSIVPTFSNQSVIGSIVMTEEDFSSRGQACYTCENSRYLICINSTCQCQPHTFFNGTVCRSQKLSNGSCTSDSQCRTDLNLHCSSNMQCGFNFSSEQTTSTTSTTTSTSTTTTAPVCSTSCLNQTWISSVNRFARWLFDGDFVDQTRTYNLTSTNGVSFTTDGYAGQAAVFTPNSNQLLNGPNIPLENTSFTVDTWLYITQVRNIQDHAIFGVCPVASLRRCLHLTIRQTSGVYKLYLGFFGDDLQGIIPLQLHSWYHVAFVFDYPTRRQSIYLNGILDTTRIALGVLSLGGGDTLVGYISAIAAGYSYNNYFLGYLDQMTVSSVPKSSCEILDIATLVAYFTFDTAQFLLDSGPNALQATTSSTSSLSNGRISQAITFNGSSSSYYQVAGFTALGIANRPFSISVWIRPVSLSGVIIHVSANATGGDGGWCLPFLAFATNGSLVAQISNSNGVISVLAPSNSIGTSVWSHLVQTWSSTNGLRLYVNNILVASHLTLATSYVSSFTKNFVTLGNSLNGVNTCNSSAVDLLRSYAGDMDDFRVYSRELSTDDICRLYTK